MARLIYAAIAAALAALVAGFFVNTSSVPLWVSIGLSAVVMLMILFGWSRRIRSDMDLLTGEDEPGPVVDIVDSDELVELEEEAFRPARQKPAPLRRRSAERERASATAVIEPTDRPAPKPRTKAGPPAKRRPAAASREPKPVAKKKPPARKKPAKTAARSGGRKVLVIPGRAKFHNKGCRFAKGDDLREVSETTARNRGYEPCTVCGA